jgi:hypothetical protein
MEWSSDPANQIQKRCIMETKTCPVCEWEIKDAGITIKAGGGEITICCDDCARKVKENPEKYGSATK